MSGVIHELALVWGTVVYRPYVYAFLACYLIFAFYHLGIRKTWLFLAGTYAIAFLAEYSSTRTGFPFGFYTYIEETRTRELWVSNVPFWDSLSFVFLSYFSFVVAAAARHPNDLEKGFAAGETPVIGGFLMMLLDIVIDPVALRGDRWFLGRVYFYPQGGSYFGVTIANFIGWLAVGFFSPWVFQRFKSFWQPRKTLGPRFIWGAFGVYAGVFGFNLFMTGWIREFSLLLASATVVSLTLGSLTWAIARRPLRKAVALS